MKEKSEQNRVKEPRFRFTSPEYAFRKGDITWEEGREEFRQIMREFDKYLRDPTSWPDIHIPSPEMLKEMESDMKKEFAGNGD